MAKLFYHSKLFFKRNGSTILSCIGGVGVVVTCVMAVKATPKALSLIEQEEEKKGEKLTNFEVVKTTAKIYIPTVVTGTATIACIFGANVLNKRQQASLMSAYALIDNSYKEYKNKLKELYGEEAHQKIVDSIAIEKAQDTYIHSECLCTSCNLATEDHSSEPKLFYDEYSNRYFESTIEQVITAEYHLNRNYVLGGGAPLNMLYEFLGLEPTDYGSAVGWAIDDDELYWIDFNHRKVTLDDGLECYIIETPFGPKAYEDGYYW